jgi:hypothetical protein
MDVDTMHILIKKGCNRGGYTVNECVHAWMTREHACHDFVWKVNQLK